jgi:hypothetical protein
MSVQKIVGWIALIVAVVGVFTSIPYEATILVVAGLIVGCFIAAEDHVRVIVTALALAALSGTLGPIPAVGSYLAAILANIGVVTAGAALMIILLNIYRRFKP